MVAWLQGRCLKLHHFNGFIPTMTLHCKHMQDKQKIDALTDAGYSNTLFERQFLLFIKPFNFLSGEHFHFGTGDLKMVNLFTTRQK